VTRWWHGGGAKVVGVFVWFYTHTPPVRSSGWGGFAREFVGVGA